MQGEGEAAREGEAATEARTQSQASAVTQRGKAKQRSTDTETDASTRRVAVLRVFGGETKHSVAALQALVSVRWLLEHDGWWQQQHVSNVPLCCAERTTGVHLRRGAYWTFDYCTVFTELRVRRVL